jgi:alkylhydroperoxidase family enzyme
MGHCEMLLAVAGLENDKIAERCEKLARGNWADFTAAERTAFGFAHKQAKTPWTIDNDDVSRLIDHFGRERALDVIWWSCRCHFMTRVADAFQLPLERNNVFQPPKPPPKLEQGSEAEK